MQSIGRPAFGSARCIRPSAAATEAAPSAAIPSPSAAPPPSSDLPDLLWRLSGASPSARLACLRTLAEIEALETEYECATDRELEGTTARLRAELASLPWAATSGDLSPVLPRAFAAVRESARRALNLWLHREQLLGGLLLLRGSAIEMPTGEGKTLVAVLAAYARSLCGRGSHVVTVNAYLAARDRAWVGPVYERLGCSVGVVTEEVLGDEAEKDGEELDERDAFEAEQGIGGWADGLEVSLGIDRERDEDDDEQEIGGEDDAGRASKTQRQTTGAVASAPSPPRRPAESYPPGPEQARLALACDVTYLTASQLGFLWLGDATADRPSDLVLRRPLESAVVDEIDAVLLDDARQNLILSGRTALEDEEEEGADEDGGWGPTGDVSIASAEGRRPGRRRRGRDLRSRLLRTPSIDPTVSGAEAPSAAPLRRERLGVLAAAGLQAACVLDEVLAAEDQGASSILEGAFDALVFPRRRHAAMTPLGMQRAAWALLDAGHLAIVREVGKGEEEKGKGGEDGEDEGKSVNRAASSSHSPDSSASVSSQKCYVLVSAENPTPPVVGVAPRLLPRRAALLPVPDPRRSGSFALRADPPAHLVRDDPDAPFSELLRARGLELVRAPDAELAARATAAALWGHRLSLGRHVSRGLRALHCYQHDVDYLIRDGRVYIIDASTGRARPSTRWSAGLHEAVEAKHGLEIGRERGEVASINYATLFRLYPRLCGMTGTAYTQRDELFKAYALDVARVPPHERRKRVDEPLEVFATARDLGQRLARVADETLRAGRPLLVGTASVEASEQALLALQPALQRHPGAHVNVLNARPERARREAQIVAQAGIPGTVTVATGMAGRGTDVTVGGNSKGLALALLEQVFGRKRAAADDADGSPEPQDEAQEPFDPLADGSWDPWSDGLPPWEEPAQRTATAAAPGASPAASPLARVSATLPPVVAHSYASRATMEASGLPQPLLRAFDLAVQETKRSGVNARGLPAHEIATALEAAGEARALLQRSGALNDGGTGRRDLRNAAADEESGEGAFQNADETWSFRTPLPRAAAARASRHIELALRWLETGRLSADFEETSGGAESDALSQGEASSEPTGVPDRSRSPRLPPPPGRPRLAAYALAQWLLFDEQCRAMGAAARRAGGLRVVVSGLLPTRSELQLRGRAGRQGDPGDTFALASFDEPVLAANLPAFVLSQLRMASDMGAGDALPTTCRRHALSAQRAIERSLEEEREARQKADDVLGAHRGAAHRLRRALLLASPAAQDTRARSLAHRLARDAVRAAVRDWQRESAAERAKNASDGQLGRSSALRDSVSAPRAALRLVIARALQHAERASSGALRVDFAAKDFAAEFEQRRRERRGAGVGSPVSSGKRLCASVDADDARGRVRITFPPDIDLVDLEALTEGIAAGFGDDRQQRGEVEGALPPELPMPESLSPFWNIAGYEGGEGGEGDDEREEETEERQGGDVDGTSKPAPPTDEAAEAASTPSSAYLGPLPHWMRRVGDRDAWERLALGSELKTLQDLGEVAVVESAVGAPQLRADETLIRKRAEEQTRVDALTLVPRDTEPFAPPRPGAVRRVAETVCRLFGSDAAPQAPSELALNALATWLRDALFAVRTRSIAATTAYMTAVIEVGQELADREGEKDGAHGEDTPTAESKGAADSGVEGGANQETDVDVKGSDSDISLRSASPNRSSAPTEGVDREFADALIESFAGSFETMLKGKGADALVDGSLDSIDFSADPGPKNVFKRNSEPPSSAPLTPAALQAAQAARDLVSEASRRSALAIVDRAWSSFLREFRVLEASANLRSFSHLSPEDELRLESEGAFDDLLATLRPALAKATFAAELDEAHLDVYLPIARGDVVIRAAKKAFG